MYHSYSVKYVIMQAILIIIEKLNGSYSAYSPNLPGCVAEGTSREEVERNMINAVEEQLQLLRARAQRGLKEELLMQGPLENNIQCMGKTKSGKQCRYKASKDGLCGQHWRPLYGHEMNAGTVASKRFCLVCGYKEGRNELVSPFDPCPGKKIQNSDTSLHK